MKTRKLITAGVLSASLLGGGAVGALYGAPSLSSAQEADDDTVQPDDSSEMRRGRHGRLHAGLDAAAEALGLTAAELRNELADGSSIADVAAERDVEVQTVIDAMVAEARATLQEKVDAGDIDADRAAEIESTIVERVTAAVNGEGRLGGPGFGHHHRGPGRGLETAAEALGITAEELRTELADGSSIADVAGERGVDVQTVIDAMVAEATEKITAFVNGEAPAGGPAGEVD